MSQTLVAIFDNHTTANAAAEKLVKAGFSRSAIDVKTTDGGASGVARTTTTTTTRTEDDDAFGSIGRFFSDLFGGDDNDGAYAGHYSEAVRRGHAVLSVEVDDAKVDAAHAHLVEAGAVDVDEQVTAWRGSGYTGDTTAKGMASSGAATAADAQGVIPVVEEQLEVGKRRVDQGRVRVVTRVASKPVHESVQLQSERAVIERHAVDRPASEADLAGFKERTVEVRESAEQAVVSKTAHVVEEVSVGKQISTETKEIDDQVRYTEVDVVREDGKTVNPASTTTQRPEDRRN